MRNWVLMTLTLLQLMLLTTRPTRLVTDYSFFPCIKLHASVTLRGNFDSMCVV